MTDDPFIKWRPQIDLAIIKHAASATSEERRDIRQEVMVAFVETQGELLMLDALEEGRAKAFAYTVARNAIIAYTQTGHERVSRRSVPLEEVQENLIWKSYNIDIDRALDSLSDEEETVIRALYYEGRSQEQVAESLGQTRHWVRSKRESALAELKRLLKN